MALTLDAELAKKYVDTAGLERAVAAAKKTYRVFLSDRGRYADVAGWVDPEASAVQCEEIIAKAEEIKHDADVFLLVGVGGSNQAARAVIEALPKRSRPRIVYAGNTLSSERVADILETAKQGGVYVNVIAKNFATLEPGSHYRVLRAGLAARYGREELAKRFILTGSAGSRLEEMARENGNLFLSFPRDVGGRFSAFTPVGLLPMAVAGVDVDALLRGARDMADELRSGGDAATAAAVYAATRNCLSARGFTVEMFASFEPRLAWFGKWWLQLFGESEGKQGRGIFPACSDYSEDLHAIGQYMQEGRRILMESFLSVRNPGASVCVPPDPAAKDGFDYLDNLDFADINRAAESGTIAAHDAGGVPCFRFTIDRIDEYHFGQLFYFFMTACAVSALVLGVNPFDQEGVEQYKRRMFEFLKPRG